MRSNALAMFLSLAVSTLCLSQAAQAVPLTFNVDGVVTDASNNPLEAAAVTFQIDIKDPAGSCLLYRELFNVNMTGSNGYFSIILGKQTNSVAGGESLEKVFSNQGTTISGLSCTYTPASTHTRTITVSFNDGVTAQTFSTQEIQAVPFALQAQAVNGYGTGELLKVNPTDVAASAVPNNALNQAQYEEFWRVVTNPLAAYLPTTGEVTIVSGNNKVNSILGQALPAVAPTNGQVLVSNGTTWALQSLSTGSVTSVTATAPVVAGGTATAPVISMPAATTSVSGHLTSTDWNTFNAKQSSALASGKVWVGNSSGAAAEVSMSGDATIAVDGTVTLKNTGTAGTFGSATLVPIVTTDAQGRITSVTTTAPSDVTKLPLAGGTMSGAIAMGAQDITNTGNITMAANKYLGLSANTTPGSVAGQMWYDTGIIKYFDGSTVKSLGVAGAGITSLNGLSAATQTFAIGTSGNAPLFTSTTSTHTLDIPMASASGSVTAGLLSNAEYVTLNAKQGNALASANVWVGNASGGAQARALSGDVTMDNAGATSLAAIKGKTVDSTAAATMGQILFFDSVADKWKASASTAPTAGQVLKWNDTNKNWEPGTDTAGWTAVDASYAAKGIVQFQTDAATSGINVASGVANVVRTTTGTSSTILSLDGSGIANMYAAGIKGATSGTVTLQSTATTANYSLTLPAAQGAANQTLSNNGSGVLSWVTALTSISDVADLASAKMWVGNASGKAVEVSMSGDATMADTGALTLASTITAAGPIGGVSTIPVITYDAKGRLTTVTPATVDDTTKLPLAGGTLTGLVSSSVTPGSIAFASGGGNISAGSGGTSFMGGGQIYGAAYATASTTLDFNNGNVITTSAACNNFSPDITLQNMHSGGHYTVVITDSGFKQCNFASSGDVFVFINANSTRVPNSSTLYRMEKVGSTIYVSWQSQDAAIVGTSGATSTFGDIDFSKRNIQYTSLACGTFQFINLKEGGSYTFVVKGTTSATCSFTAVSDLGASLTVHLPIDHGPTAIGKHTVYNFFVAGADVYVSWTTGL